MADNLLPILLAAGAAGGYYLYQKSKTDAAAAAAAAATSSSSTPTSTVTTYSGVTIPADISGQLQNSWNIYGKPTDQAHWVNAATALYPLKTSVWNNVWTQWYAYYTSNNASWPTNSVLQGWIATAEANFG